MGLKDIEDKIDQLTPIIEDIMDFVDIAAPIIAAVFPPAVPIVATYMGISATVNEIKENTEEGHGGASNKLIRNLHVLNARNTIRMMAFQAENMRLLKYRGIQDQGNYWSEEQAERTPGEKYLKVSVRYEKGENDIGFYTEEVSAPGENQVQLQEEVNNLTGDINTVDYIYKASLIITVRLINNLVTVAKMINWYTPKTVKEVETGEEVNADISGMYGYKSLNASQNDYWLTESLRFLVPMWFNGIQSH